MKRLISIMILVSGSYTLPLAMNHPGVVHGAEEIAFAKAKVTEGIEPWSSAFEQLQESSYSSLNYDVNPFSSVDCGYYNRPNVGCDETHDLGMGKSKQMCEKLGKGRASRRLEKAKSSLKSYKQSDFFGTLNTVQYIKMAAAMIAVQIPGSNAVNTDDLVSTTDAAFCGQINDGVTAQQLSVELYETLARARRFHQARDLAKARFRERTQLLTSGDGVSGSTSPSGGHNPNRSLNLWAIHPRL